MLLFGTNRMSTCFFCPASYYIISPRRLQQQIVEETLASRRGESALGGSVRSHWEHAVSENLGTDPATAQTICIIFARPLRIMRHFKTDTLGTRPSFSGLEVWVSGCGFAQLPNHLTTEPPNQRLGTDPKFLRFAACPPSNARCATRLIR